jgi:hypothetical protein
MGARSVLLLSAGLLVSAAFPALAWSQEQPAALITHIEGVVSLRNRVDAPAIVLRANVEIGRRLYAGEQIRIDPGGVLRYWSDGRIREMRGPSDWHSVEPSHAQSQKLLEEYGRVGGRSRAEPAPVYSPAANGVVVPGEFAVKWNVGPTARPVAVSIHDMDGRHLWRQEGLETVQSPLVPKAARQALTRYRTEEGEGPLVLRILDSDGSVSGITFALISRRGELALEEELARWDKDSAAIVSHLGRAAAFSRARVLPRAAEEYEAALLIAPESRDLLLSTIAAHYRTGNVRRAEELIKRLPEGTPPP